MVAGMRQMRGMDGYMRGVNLGGWLSQFDAPTKEHFDTFITEEDIRRIAGMGLDHVRVPVDYTVIETEDGIPKEEGYQYIDKCVQWCRNNGLHMIIDIHKTYGYSFDPLKKDDKVKFFYDSDFTADYGQVQTFNNLSYIDGVIEGLDNGADIWGENGDGIADYAYQLNCIHDYNYCNFSADIAERGIDMYTDAYYSSKDQAQWGYHHQNPVVHVGDASAQIQRAETIEDVDVDAAKEAYNKARGELIDYLGKALAAEITYMGDVANALQ